MSSTPQKPTTHRIVSLALRTVPVWAGAGAENDILLGLAARITRNLPGIPFPGWSSAEDRKKVYETLLPELRSIRMLGVNEFTEMSELNLNERRVLLDRKFISPCMAARQDGCYISSNKGFDRVVLINEEEHLVVRCYANGTDPEGSFRKFNSLAKALDRAFSFAVDPKKGYLCSAPSEVGDGMQLHFFLHLPGLNLAGMIDQVARGAEKLLVNLSPLHTSEENTGNTFVLSVGPARYGTSHLMFDHALDVVQEIISREWELRYKLLYTRTNELLDVIGRSYGLLRYAHRLSYGELLQNLSYLRLGAILEVIQPHAIPSNFHFCEILGDLLLELSPGSLAECGTVNEEDQERDRALTVVQTLHCTEAEFISPII